MRTVPEPAHPVTLAEALTELLAITEQRVRDGVRSPATLGMQEAHRRWWEQVLGPARPLDQVDELVLEQLATRPRPRQAHARPPAGPNTLRKRFSTLRAALELAHRRRKLERVPAFPPVLVPRPPRAPILVSAEQAERLFASLPRHRAEWYWIALWTAQHASDVERMTWADVDLSANTMLVRNTKNRTPELRVRIPRPLLEVLRQMHERDRPRPTDPLVRPWPSRKTTLPRHCRACGLPALNATALRHTCLSWIVRRTGITPSACRFAGHSSPAMMARTYAHALPAQLEDVTEALESMAAQPANDNGGGPTKQPK
jgi:integrase